MAGRFRGEPAKQYKVLVMAGFVAFKSHSLVAAEVKQRASLASGAQAPPASRLGKVGHRKKIDGSPLEYRVEDEDIFLSPSNPEKAFSVEKWRLDDGQGFEAGHIEYRIAYYMRAYKLARKGKWVFGQYAPLMTPADLRLVFEKMEVKGWLQQ